MSHWIHYGLREWVRTLTAGVFSLFLHCLVAVAVCSGLVYLFIAFWHMYVETHTGQMFVARFPGFTEAFRGVLDYRPYLFALYTTISALKACFAAALVGRIFLLTRYAYEGRGWWLQMLFWGVPCLAISTMLMTGSHEIDWKPAAVCGAVAVAILLPRIVRLVSDLLPEIDVLWEVTPPADKGNSRTQKKD